MSNTEVFELDVWKDDWGLASVDTQCLLALTYAKFNAIPLRINTSLNPFKTPHGHLPILRCGTSTITSINNIIEFFRKKNYNSESAISPEENALIMAYKVMLKEKLFPALQFIWWIDKKNVDELIRPWYCKALPFPFKFYYPGKFERQARTMLETLYGTDDITVIENQVYSDAQNCLTLLSTRLGDSEFFFGCKPTILDAIIFSYLAPLLNVPLPNPALQNHLKACTNLVKYVSRISRRYFETEYQKYEKHKAKENEERLRSDSDSEFPNKRRNQLLAGFVATLAMAGYALSTGMVEVPVRDSEISDDAAEYILNDEDAE